MVEYENRKCWHKVFFTRLCYRQNRNKRFKYNFYSCNGVYEFDDNIGISKMMKKCNIYFKIDNLLEEKSYEHVSITIFKKNIRKDISFNKFCEMVDENKFRVYLDFYSCFAQGLLIKGYCKKSEIELFITEINDVQFTFD